MDAQATQTRRAVSAAVIGNVLEWYDFAVYAFVAGYLARKFFPPGDEVTALLSTFLAYGLGFVARPLGGIILGRLGDTHGRKTALLITIALMAIGTVLIGILPTYAAIGIAAPLLLVVAGCCKDFPPAANGVLPRPISLNGRRRAARLVRELPADQRRGGSVARLRHCGLVQYHPDAGADGRVGLARSVPAWRHPRAGRPVDAAHDRRNAGLQTSRRGATAAATTDSSINWLMAARAFGFTIVWTVCFYVLLNYMPTYTQKYLKLSASAALWSNTIGLLALLLFIPIFGRLSDKIGRKPLLLACCVAYIVLPYPIFSYLLGGASYTSLIMVQILFAILIAMFSGPGPPRSRESSRRARARPG
jgi:MHS family proline/betaine transporter-like MFS transporter